MSANRQNARLRALMSPSVQTQSRYKGRLKLLQTRLHSDADPINAQHKEPFGFTGYAPDGSDNIVLSFGGNRSRSIVIMAFNEQYKIKIEPGEAATYNQWGDFVRLTKGGDVHAKARTRVFADTPKFECSADALVNGKLHVKGEVTSDSKISTPEDVVAGIVSLKTHTTTNVTPGTGISGVPQ